MKLVAALGATAWIAVCACGETNRAEPERPRSDYGQQPARDPDGRVMGADNIAPSDQLQEGATVGSEGVEPAPPWEGEHDSHPRQKSKAGTAKKAQRGSTVTKDAGR